MVADGPSDTGDALPGHDRALVLGARCPRAARARSGARVLPAAAVASRLARGGSDRAGRRPGLAGVEPSGAHGGRACGGPARAVAVRRGRHSAAVGPWPRADPAQPRFVDPSRSDRPASSPGRGVGGPGAGGEHPDGGPGRDQRGQARLRLARRTCRRGRPGGGRRGLSRAGRRRQAAVADVGHRAPARVGGRDAARPPGRRVVALRAAARRRGVGDRDRSRCHRTGAGSGRRADRCAGGPAPLRRPHHVRSVDLPFLEALGAAAGLAVAERWPRRATRPAAGPPMSRHRPLRFSPASSGCCGASASAGWGRRTWRATCGSSATSRSRPRRGCRPWA